MSTMQVTAHIPVEEGAKFDQEAKDLGTSRTDYAKQIILQRHNKTIEIANADASVIQARMEGKLEILTEQNAALQREVALANEKSGLNGVETSKKSVKTQIDEALAAKDAEYKLNRLEESIKDLTDERNELEKERDELKAVVDANSRMDRMMEKGTQILEVAARVAPKPVERIMNGLAGLLGGPDQSGLDGTSMAPEQQLALNAGQAIMQDIDPDNRTPVVELLQYMAANQAVIAQFQKTRGFQAWLQTQH